MRVCFAVCSLGIGHATRSLPIIRRLVDDGHEVHLISYGRPMLVLKEELGSRVRYFSVPDYQIHFDSDPGKFFPLFLASIPSFIKAMFHEYHEFLGLHQRYGYDIVISDSRYGVFKDDVPSYLITHQVRILNPMNWAILEYGTENWSKYFLTCFNKILVPDFEKNDLSGRLSHGMKTIEPEKIEYVGILTDFNKKKMENDIDYLISISGPGGPRKDLQGTVMEQVADLDGRKIITLGMPEARSGRIHSMERGLDNAEVYNYLPKSLKENVMNRSDLMISRSGYSTLMDLVALEKKALFIPTPQQTEQEYLSMYHNKKRTFLSVDQEKLDLKKDVARARSYSGIKSRPSVKSTINKVMDVITSSGRA